MNTIILQTIARSLLHIMVLFSVYMLFRGHNLPGGGFIAALIASAALVLQLLAFGHREAQKIVPVDWVTITGIGLALALLTGLAPLALGYPFLTSAFTFVDVPLLGEIELTSALFFDVGVFLAVVGTVLMIMFRLGAE